MNSGERLREFFVTAYKEARAYDKEGIELVRGFVIALTHAAELPLKAEPDKTENARVLNELCAIDRAGTFRFKLKSEVHYNGFDVGVTSSQNRGIRLAVGVTVRKSEGAWVASIHGGEEFLMSSQEALRAEANRMLLLFERQLAETAWQPMF